MQWNTINEIQFIAMKYNLMQLKNTKNVWEKNCGGSTFFWKQISGGQHFRESNFLLDKIMGGWTKLVDKNVKGQQLLCTNISGDTNVVGQIFYG